MKRTRLNRVPEHFVKALKTARRARGWSQAELGRKAGLPQPHVSGIETGRIVPRFDTLLDVVRVLDLDLVLVPRSLVPAANALVRDATTMAGQDNERPLYAFDEDDEEHELDERGEP